MRIELTSSAWKAVALTIMLYLHLIELPDRVELSFHDYKSSVITLILRKHYLLFDGAKLSKIFQSTKYFPNFFQTFFVPHVGLEPTPSWTGF